MTINEFHVWPRRCSSEEIGGQRYDGTIHVVEGTAYLRDEATGLVIRQVAPRQVVDDLLIQLAVERQYSAALDRYLRRMKRAVQLAGADGVGLATAILHHMCSLDEDEPAPVVRGGVRYYMAHHAEHFEGNPPYSDANGWLWCGRRGRQLVYARLRGAVTASSK